MTIVSALKKLFKKIAGKETTGGTIDEIINELSSEYPPLIVTGTIEEVEVEVEGSDEVEVRTVCTTDKKILADILPAIRAGKTVYLDVDAGGYTMRGIVSAYDDSGEIEGMVAFSAAIPDLEGQATEYFSIHGSAAISGDVEIDTWTPLPS